jgi:hypothetical protein
MKLSPEMYVMIYGTCTFICLLLAFFFVLQKDALMSVFTFCMAVFNGYLMSNPPEKRNK